MSPSPASSISVPGSLFRIPPPHNHLHLFPIFNSLPIPFLSPSHFSPHPSSLPIPILSLTVFESSYISNSFRIQSCPDPDWFFPDPDPAKSFGSARIRIHKTDFNTGIRTWICSPNTNTDPYELGSGSAPMQSRYYLTLLSLSPHLLLPL